jgi:hypothetical protein
VLSHSALLSGPWPPLRCTNCKGLCYRDRTGHGAIWAMVIVVVALAASYPSPISDSLLYGLSPQMVAITRAGIWAFSVLAAFFLFSFVGSLAPLAQDVTIRTHFNLGFYLSSWIFRGGMLWWMYVIYREVSNVS